MASSSSATPAAPNTAATPAAAAAAPAFPSGSTSKNWALIGNCRYSAIAELGRIRWLCWPRMDSSFVFGNLLDEDLGGDFRVEVQHATNISQEYIPNTNVLRTLFESPHGDVELFDFAPRFLQHERSYKPAMLCRILRPVKGRPRVRICCEPVYDYGKTKPEAVMESNHIDFHGLPGNMRLTTNAPLTNVLEKRFFVLGSEKHLALTYGQPLEAGLEITCNNFLSKTTAYWRHWVRNMRVPRDYQGEVIRSALVLKLHQYEDTGALLAATTTSIAEFPGSGRCWDYRYCWLRDSYFTLSAMERLGHTAEMEKFLYFLQDICISCEDHLQPLYSISGDTSIVESTLDHLKGFNGDGPVRIGNQAYEHVQNDAYGEMILAVRRILLDTRFKGGEHGVDATLDLVTQLLDQIEKRLTDPDAGLWELRGTEQLHSFTLLLHWAGAKACIDIGEEHKKPDLVQRATKIAAEARELLETRCWDEKQGCLTQAADQDHLDAAMLMALHFHFLDPKSDKARSHVQAIRKNLSLENGLLLRYKVEDDFGRQEAAFTVCSFWLVEAMAMVGMQEEATELFQTLLSHSNSVGLFSEDLCLGTKVGEEKQSGNFPQTYSHVGVINAAFRLSREWD